MKGSKDTLFLNKPRLTKLGLLFAISPATVADGVLGLDGEEEAGGESLDVVGARHEALVGHVGRVEVAVEGEGQVPHAGKEQPTEGRLHSAYYRAPLKGFCQVW